MISINQKQIKTTSSYSSIHTKLLVIDNVYLILPVISNDDELTKKCFRAIFELILKDNESIVIDDVNLNAMFNDKQMLSGLFNSFISLLIDSNVETTE